MLSSDIGSKYKFGICIMVCMELDEQFFFFFFNRELDEELVQNLSS